MAAKKSGPIKKAHMVTGGIALVVVVVTLWALNNVSFVTTNAAKVGVKV
ncbi:hypothetical protein [Vibrio sp. HN007]